MRIERASSNQVKVFVSNEELAEHGLTKDEVGKNTTKWNDFLHEVINFANQEFNLIDDDELLIDIFSFHSKELMFVVTKVQMEDLFEEDELSLLHLLKETEGENRNYFFEFSEIEDLIQCAKRIYPYITGGDLYSFNEAYYFSLEQEVVKNNEFLESLILEYGNVSSLTDAYIREYGNLIVKDYTIETLLRYFK